MMALSISVKDLSYLMEKPKSMIALKVAFTNLDERVHEVESNQKEYLRVVQ